jgi:hypothetical protein
MGLASNGDAVGDRHLSLLRYASSCPFDEPLQRLHCVVEGLEIPEE